MSHPTRARVLVRSTDERWLGGVCGGLAAHFGVQVSLVRVLFVVAALVGGVGVLAYVLLWVLVPSGGAVRTGSGSRALDLMGVLGLVSMAIGVLMALSLLGLPVRVSLWVPLLLAGAGVVLLWRQGDDARARAERAATPQPFVQGVDRSMVARVVVGLVLLLIGVVGILVPRLSWVTLVAGAGGDGGAHGRLRAYRPAVDPGPRGSAAGGADRDRPGGGTRRDGHPGA